MNLTKKEMNELNRLRLESRIWETKAIRMQAFLPVSVLIAMLAIACFVIMIVLGTTTMVPLCVAVISITCAIISELLTHHYWKNHARARQVYREQIKQTLEKE